MHDNQYPEKILERLWQTPATMVHSWGWHSTDYNWKSATEMFGYLVSNAAKGGNYLLNVGPMPDGRMPAAAIHRLREMGGWLVANGAAIYDTQPLKDMAAPAGVVFTESKRNKGDRIVFASIIKPLTSGELSLPFTASSVINCEILETGQPIEFTVETSGKSLKIKLNKAQSQMTDGIPVIQLRLKAIEDK
ncbi:hypothetical protein AQ505_06685 [Pedobacter sp. PACM 27299]|uniref:alpha-L-fucosidase n=1 Tax=Pedobacter sp. PACM 27299 TaxID=1727164 RepID=UPI0007059267|nr:alpha-L-fucosidase [Pedobacter sp. PACM 27299]ALL05208.1 hypothetical protein AQ505_06685 [Pedobacter sp. PACM 27299]